MGTRISSGSSPCAKPVKLVVHSDMAKAIACGACDYAMIDA